MASPPTPPEAVPAFVADRFAEHDPETLRDIVAYEAGRMRSSEVPTYVSEVFVMQSDETKRAIASYARDLAAYEEAAAERAEAAQAAETVADGGTHGEAERDADDRSTDDDGDDGPSFATGPMFG